MNGSEWIALTTLLAAIFAQFSLLRQRLKRIETNDLPHLAGKLDALLRHCKARRTILVNHEARLEAIESTQDPSDGD